MRKLHFLLLFVCILVMEMSFRQPALAEVVSDGEGIIIYLDAGHDNVHGGCHKNGLKEEILNLKIAKYCKEKLEQYEGVTVYMSRTKADCPNPGTDSATDNILRVEDAASKNTTLYVAIHNNSYKYSSAKGAIVFYPNTHYNKAVSREGKAVAETVLSKLVALGLKDRGIAIRNSEDNTRYPDNSLADYYNIIKTAKLNGFPAIIIEHAFMTNSSDVNSFLKSETGLKKLGEADAKGIASYYGLNKKKTTRVNLKKVTQETEDEIKLTWDAFEGADYYVVLRRELLTSPKESKDPVYSDWEIIGETKKKHFTDKEFEPETTYYYTVKAHIAETDSFSKKHPTGFSVTTQ